MTETPWIALVDEPIDLLTLQGRIDDPDVGAHGWFLGVTRRTTDSRVTECLSYDSHREMAMKELKRLADQAMRNHSLKHLVIVHRLGEVPVGEASVVIGCSSAHRVDTFDALRWIMDTLKKDVPIWKREMYVDGTTEWVHPGPDPKP